MFKKLTILLFCLTIMFAAFLFQEKSRAAGKESSTATATENQLRIRSGPGTSFRIIGFLNKGQAVTVLDSNDNWLKISSPFGEGWIAKQYASMSKEQQQTSGNITGAASSGVITGDSLNVRKQPSTNSPIAGKLSKGTAVTIYSQQNNWYEIRYNNQQAWISADYVSNSNNSPANNSGNSASGITGTVTASSLCVRSNYSLNAKVVGSVSNGQTFAILDEVNNWVKIEYKPGSYGWAAGWYFEKNSGTAKHEQPAKENVVTILEDGSNIRKAPTVQSDVLKRANAGETFAVSKIENDWYEIKLKDGSKGYIAGWIVSVSGAAPQVVKPGTQNYLKNKVILIDPGHGGVDNGTTGAEGTLEKNLTLKTAKLLYDKLMAAGAKVYLTRTNDSYIGLSTRVSYSRALRADAFISLHYDSNFDSSVRGMTGYYYHDFQKPLADTVYSSLVSETGMKNRGVRFGDFHVIRENSQKATLIELGYLSNPNEELNLNTAHFQESAATGIYNGLARYFKNN